MVSAQPATPHDIVSAAETNATPFPKIKSISATAPLEWLGKGLADLYRTGWRGLLYGFIFALMGVSIWTIYETKWQLTMALTAGFFLTGPFVCTGLYELSRQRERGEPASLRKSLVCFRRNAKSIAFFSAMLTFAMVIFARVSIVIFALFSNRDFPTMQGMLHQVFTFNNVEFIGVWLMVAFLFMSLVFAIAVVAVPMMLDRGADTMVSVFTSAKALWVNTLPLYFWAFLIVALIGLSLALAMVPLILTAPLVGHATWHAYRDLVE